MEYQFIRDPLYGYRARFNEEHALFGRWLTEEIGLERLAELEMFITQVLQEGGERWFEGKEIRLTLSPAEALLEDHSQFHGKPDLEAYRDDQLTLDESGMVAVSGFEDFTVMLSAWREFVGHERRRTGF